MVVPTPTAGPQTDAISGLGKAASARRKRCTGASPLCGGLFRKSPRSLPAVKASWLPVISATRTAPSAAACSSPSASVAYIAAVIAFLRAGRSKRSSQIPSATPTFTSSVILAPRSSLDFSRPPRGRRRSLRPQHHLRAAEQRHRAAGLAVRDHRVPDLGGAPHVRGGGHHLDRTVARGAEVIALQFDR